MVALVALSSPSPPLSRRHSALRCPYPHRSGHCHRRATALRLLAPRKAPPPPPGRRSVEFGIDIFCRPGWKRLRRCRPVCVSLCGFGGGTHAERTRCVRSLRRTAEGGGGEGEGEGEGKEGGHVLGQLCMRSVGQCASGEQSPARSQYVSVTHTHTRTHTHAHTQCCC